MLDRHNIVTVCIDPFWTSPPA